MYSLVRHPLYLGNYFVGFGVALSLCVWWLPVIYSLSFCVYYERIVLVEEAFLRRQFGEEFNLWTSRTPAFLPRLSRWKPPTLSFSIRNVLKREYSGFMVIVLGHGGVEFVKRFMIHRDVVYEVFWVTILSEGVLCTSVLVL
jgi:hypothetical protein